jgi:hypothetical protein
MRRKRRTQIPRPSSCSRPSTPSAGRFGVRELSGCGRRGHLPSRTTALPDPRETRTRSPQWLRFAKRTTRSSSCAKHQREMEKLRLTRTGSPTTRRGGTRAPPPGHQPRTVGRREVRLTRPLSAPSRRDEPSVQPNPAQGVKTSTPFRPPSDRPRSPCSSQIRPRRGQLLLGSSKSRAACSSLPTHPPVGGPTRDHATTTTTDRQPQGRPRLRPRYASEPPLEPRF